MIPIILGITMFVMAYLTYTEKFNLFVTYYEAKKDEAYLQEMSQKRKKHSTRLFLLMGTVAIISGVFRLLGIVFYEYLFIAIYMFFLIYLLGSTFGAQGTKTVYIILALAASFLYFSTSFRYLFDTNEIDTTTTPGTVVITGANTVEIALNDIVSIELLDTLPEHGKKIGSAREFNGTFRGTYHMADGSIAKLYLNGSNTCIKMQTNEDLYYIALFSPEETERAFQEIEKLRG